MSEKSFETRTDITDIHGRPNTMENGSISSLDQLIGFSEARRRLENPEEFMIPEEPAFIPHRVFVNHVDYYNTKYLSTVLSEQVFGKVEEAGEEEEAGDEEEEGNETKTEDTKPPPTMIEVVGTMRDRTKIQLEHVKETVCVENEEFFDRIWKCGFIVYDITSDTEQIKEAQWVLQGIDLKLAKLQEESPKTYESLDELRVFILISTVMTWAQTKPIDPEDPETPFVETDYRKRKPHPNYKNHIALEKEVVEIGKRYKKKLKTLVIASGITYGFEEEDLHFLFRLAWEGIPELPIFNKGNNTIPLIHIKDLCSIVSGIIKKGLGKRQYILALEQSPSKLKQIVKGISKAIGTGHTKVVPKEDAFLFSYVTQEMFDRVGINLTMEPNYILEQLEIQWQSDLNLAENIKSICNEYKNARALRPIKMIIHGPPAVGKTRIAKRLCNYYKLHYINIKTIIDESIETLKNNIDKAKAAEKAREEKEAAGDAEKEEEEEDEEEEEEEGETVEEWLEQLQELETGLTTNENGKLSDEIIIRLLKKKLMSNACQNQGYILDSFPKTIEQAKVLFEAGDDENDEEAEEAEEEGEEQNEDLKYNKKIMPELIISLQADDDLLCQRVMHLPEEEVQETRYAEEPMLRRLALFRENNTEDDTVLNYFDERENHPMIISAMDDYDSEMTNTFEKIITKIGKPRNYGKSVEELEMEQRLLEEEKARLELQAKLEQEEIEKKLQEEREFKMEEWSDMMAALKKEEEEIMAVQGEPLRNYLMKFVFPTLTRGLLEVARIRPKDPVDYLAEYLFKENPEGKMFDPAYTAAAEELMKAVENIQNDLQSNIIATEDPSSDIIAENV